jgi:hypothetical protein
MQNTEFATQVAQPQQLKATSSDRPHTAPIPLGLLQSAPGRTKEEGGMKNAESRGRLCPAMRGAILEFV